MKDGRQQHESCILSAMLKGNKDNFNWRISAMVLQNRTVQDLNSISLLNSYGTEHSLSLCSDVLHPLLGWMKLWPPSEVRCVRPRHTIWWGWNPRS
jgi:hypothetical protein